MRVNAVCPGLIGGTPMREALDEASQAAGLPRAAERAKAIPMGRAGTVEDIAACALYLASPAGGWVTGKIFQVDGGTEFPAITVPTPKL